jgi:undecaprenyl-diphosphatase
MNWLVELDKKLFFAINQGWSNSILDAVFPFLTQLDNFRIVLIAAAILLLVFGKRKGRIAVIAVLIAVGLSDFTSSQVIKPMFGRIRPCVALEGVLMLVGKKTSLSFPSSHAANIVAAAVVLSYYYRRALVPLATLAILICISRVYVGVHYPFDVFAGAILGGLLAAGTVLAMQQMALVEKSGGSDIPPKTPST